MPSGPTVGEPVIGPPVLNCHSGRGARSGGRPASAPVCCALPLYMANGGAPGLASAGAAPLWPAETAPAATRSRHWPSSHTRLTWQSLSLPQPGRVERCAPLPGQAAIAAASSQPTTANASALAREMVLMATGTLAECRRRRLRLG